MYISKTATAAAILAFFQLATAAPVIESGAAQNMAIESELRVRANSGDMTVYDPNNGYGACGTQIPNSDFSAALSHEIWGADQWGNDGLNHNPNCGRRVRVTWNGRTVDVTIKDKCMGCKAGDIDLVRAAWNQITGNRAGDRLKASWTFI
jgi:hypothetical protein